MAVILQYPSIPNRVIE